MYRFDLRGYSYGEGKPLDLTWTGSNYIDGDIVQAYEKNRNTEIMTVTMG